MWLCQPKRQLWPQRGNPFNFVLKNVNELMIFWEKDGYQRVCGCVSPRGSYGTDGGILWKNYS